MAKQTTKSGRVPPRKNGDSRVRPDSSVIARAAGLLLTCIVLAAIAVSMLYRCQDSIYRRSGGEIRSASAESTLQEALKEVYPDKPQKELDGIRGRKMGTTLYISHTVTAYWVSQAFHNGWVQYAIVHGFLTGLFYTIGVWLGQMIPGWHLSSAPRRFRSVARQMGEMRATGAANIEEIIAKVDGNDRFADRLHKLQQHYSREPNRQLCREANEAYSQSEQAEALYVMLPLGFIEFLLPVFGFIGTVLGVSEAVSALRWGMNQLFDAKELTGGVISQFMLGFDGLVLAFMTTLFGLLGLAFTALFRFYLRRNAMAVIAKIDQWSEEAINLLPQEDLLKTVAEGLIVHDENGQPAYENGRPVSLLRKLEDLIREAMFEPGEDGKEPVPALQKVHHALGKLDESFQEALFEPAPEGEKPVPALQGVGRMIQVTTDAVRQIHNALMHHIYQIVGDDDRNQYTPLIIYIKDPETGEMHSVEVQGRYRSERQHGETIAWMNILTEEVTKRIQMVIDDTAKLVENTSRNAKEPLSPPPPRPLPGRLLIAPAEEPVRRIATSAAAFAVVRGTDHTTGESELVSGCYELVLGQRLPCEADRKRLPMPITGLGFSAREGTEAARFGVYMPFAPADPWQQHGARQLLPAKPLVRCAATFLSDHDVLSTNIAVVEVKGLTWLLFLARKRAEGKAGKVGLFTLALEGEKGVPQPIGDFMDGELAAEAVFPGQAYAFALRNGGSTTLVVASAGETKPALRGIKSPADVTALAFDATGLLRYATQQREIGTLARDKGGLQRDCLLDRPGQIAHLACSSGNMIYAALQDSPELLMVRMDGSSGKQPELMSVMYPRLITTLTGSSDGRFIFVGCADGSVYVRNG